MITDITTLMQSDLFNIVLRATILLGAAAFISQLLRKTAAVTHHSLWTATFVLLLTLPLAITHLPVWNLPIFIEKSVSSQPIDLDERAVALSSSTAANEVSPSGNNITASESSSEIAIIGESAISPSTVAPWYSKIQITWVKALSLIWILGVLVSLSSILLGLYRYKNIVRSSAKMRDMSWIRDSAYLRRKIGISRPVQILISPSVETPMTGGWLQPNIILPLGTSEWTEECRMSVLAHELIHIKRLDVPRQLFAMATLALYWFHPLSWFAAKQSMSSRELACDEAVLSLGIKPSEYAAHLLKLATGIRTQPVLATLPIVQKSQLEKRIMNILKPTQPRFSRVLSTMALSLVTLIGLTAAVASPTTIEIEDPPSISPIAKKNISKISSEFGPRLDPYDNKEKIHQGIDLVAEKGTPVLATSDGLVIFAGDDGNYGNHIKIKHDEKYSTQYAHLESIKVVEGQTTKLGDVIGTVGNTGKSKGPHLHYEVRLNDRVVDPREYFGDKDPEPMSSLDLGTQTSITSLEELDESNSTSIVETDLDEIECQPEMNSSFEFHGSFSSNGNGIGSKYFGRSNGDTMMQTFEDDLRLCLRIHGDVDMADHWSQINKMSQGSWVIIESEEDDLHRLIISESSGQMLYTWSINDQERPFDDFAEEWMDQMLLVSNAYWQSNTLRSRAAGLRGSIATHRGKIATKRGKIATHRGHVASLKGKIASTNGRVASLNGRIASQRGRIVSLQGRIASHRGVIAGKRGRIAGLRGELSGLRASVSSNDEGYLKRRKEVQEEIAIIEREIDKYDLAGKIAEIEEKISEYKNQTNGAIEKEIAAYDSDSRILAIQKEINRYDLDNKIAKIEKEILDYNIDQKVYDIESEIEELDADRRADEIERRLRPELRKLRAIIR